MAVAASLLLFPLSAARQGAAPWGALSCCCCWGFMEGPSLGWPLCGALLQSLQTHAFLSLPLTTNLWPPCSLSCPVLVSLMSFSILSTIAHADLWCQPWAVCMYLSFSVCFLLSCETSELTDTASWSFSIFPNFSILPQCDLGLCHCNLLL